jgi:4-methoxybenzoate monooxygenase (O-demethylating)
MSELTNTQKSPVLDVDPFSMSYFENPYPQHERMRQAGPIVRFKDYDAWGMARFGEVSSAMHDWETFISSAGVGLTDIRKTASKVLPKLLTLQIDPPEHGKYRTVFTRILTPKLTQQLREQFTAQAEELADELAARGTFDAISDLAMAFPLKVFPDAIGIRQEGRHNLLRWSDAAFNSFGPDNQLARDSIKISQEVYPWIIESCSRELLSSHGIGMKIYEAADRGEIDEEDAPSLVRPFLTAGLDTTISGLGAAMLGLVTHPEQWAHLRDTPTLARHAFEEAIRWESPISAFFRTTSRPVTVDGVTLPADAKVLLFIGAANRDPSHWEDPARYNIHRKVIGHVGFGVGIHTCIGQMIARLEGEVILAALAKRIKSIELVGQPKYKPNNTMRSLATLPVRVVPL